MDFIIENYVWFIVVGVIILMAIIGYIADKTDFGRQISFTKKEKPKKEKKVKEKIKVEAKGIKELTNQNISNNQEKDIPIEKDEIENTKDTSKNNDVKIENENIDQALFAPLTTENVGEIIPEQKDDNVELKSIEPTNLENPIVENKNTQQVSEEEDIWKF